MVICVQKNVYITSNQIYIMKKLFIMAMAFFAMSFVACGGDDAPSNPTPAPNPDPTPTPTATTFAKGADISWYTEMEADGRHFYNQAGEQTTCPQLMKQLGMNAVRLRVWVNPEKAACDFCNTADVVNKAREAKAAGMDVMIDFHYSDLWADPSRQQKPEVWQNLTFAQLLQQVATHTRSVLEAVVAAGVTPKWVQIGNETRSGMIYPDGALYDADWKPLTDGWKKFTQLYMAGYNAAKDVLPEAKVMPHLNTASKQSDNTWWLQQLKANGGKFDMVGFSHYPQVDDDSQQPTALNAQAVACMQQVTKTYGVPCMIVEFGVKTLANEALAVSITNDFMKRIKDAGEATCAGIFYWEPEVYGNWRPKSYTTFFDNWGAYDMGAFTSAGKPSVVLNAWK